MHLTGTHRKYSISDTEERVELIIVTYQLIYFVRLVMKIGSTSRSSRCGLLEYNPNDELRG